MTSPPPPETPRWGRPRTPPDRSSSSAPARRRSSPPPDTVRPFGSSADAGWSAASPPPESSPGSGTWSVKRLKNSYPMPTHSRHNLIALLSTVAASPRQTPKHSMVPPAISSAICAAAFFLQLIFHHPFRFSAPSIARES